MPVWLKAPNFQTGASRFTLSSFTLSWVVSRLSTVHLFRFAIRCWLFLDKFYWIFSNLAEYIQSLGGEDVSCCVFLLFSLSAMTQMIPEIVENPNKTTKWFVQFTLNVSIKAKILQRYYNTKERPACFFPFSPFDITTQLPFYVVQRLRIGESLSFHIVIFRTWWFVSWRRQRAIYNSLSKLLYRATSYRYMTGEIPLGPMIILGKFWRKTIVNLEEIQLVSNERVEAKGWLDGQSSSKFQHTTLFNSFNC